MQFSSGHTRLWSSNSGLVLLYWLIPKRSQRLSGQYTIAWANPRLQSNSVELFFLHKSPNVADGDSKFARCSINLLKSALYIYIFPTYWLVALNQTKNKKRIQSLYRSPHSFIHFNLIVHHSKSFYWILFQFFLSFSHSPACTLIHNFPYVHFSICYSL